MEEAAILVLTDGTRIWPIHRRPLAIGRQSENDIVVDGEAVSRVHAWVVPTTAGAMLVDRSRHGTWINGQPRTAPWSLEEGDQVRIGATLFELKRMGRARVSGAETEARGLRSRCRDWVVRYGPSEILGTAVAVGVTVGVERLTRNAAAAGYAGSIAETVVFYSVMLLRESVREAHQAGGLGRPFGRRDLLRVGRNLFLEFGAAEALDTLLLRPLCLALGVRWIGGGPGALLGKLASDVLFYGPVLAAYEWRIARGRAERVADRRRRTTAAYPDAGSPSDD